MKSNSLAVQALLFYGVRFPKHRGKSWLHERLRKLLKVSIDGEVEVFRSGLYWSLNPSDFVQKNFYWLGTYDTWQIYHIMKRLEPGSVFLDVGANFGYYSLIVSYSLKHNCKIYSFEPNLKTFERLNKNIKINGLGNVFSCQLGLSDQCATASILEKPGNSGAARINLTNGSDVVLTTLDIFSMEKRLNRIDAVKIDVEGFELRMLSGGRETIMKFRPHILIELNPVALSYQNTSVGDVIDLLYQYGYRLFEIHRETLRPLLNIPSGDGYVDAFCIHKERLDHALKRDKMIL